ncbi:MAG: Ger(x)C family spore germination protein [Clostridia bacterium]|nr:Ger(x)C family spore germination protein [Clostridia bacterium]
MRKLICIFLIVSILCGLLSGCYDRREVDELAYVLAIGLDKGKTNKLKITLQIAVPMAIGGGGEGGGDAEKASTIVTLESASMYAGLDLANNFVSKQLNLSHAKVLVVSKELAQEGGIEGFMMALPRGREIRPNMFIAVSRQSAEEYIRAVKPVLEVNPAKFYELNFRAYRYTGFTANTDLHDFYLKMKSLYSQPVAILAGVGRFDEGQEFDVKGSTFDEKNRSIPLEGDFVAGEITKSGGVKAEIMGLAVFDGAKMVGELDGEATMYYLMIQGDFNNSYMTMHDPLQKDKLVILNIKRSRNPKRDVKMINGKPVIDVKIRLEADIQVLQSGINYEMPQNLVILEKAYEDFIKEGMKRLLYLTSQEYNTDIFGFGERVKQQFITWGEWEKYGWLKKYKDSTFNVDVDLKIRRPGLTIRSSPIQYSNGEGAQ